MHAGKPQIILKKLTRACSQVIDVFAVAPQETRRNLSQDQAKAMLSKNGINPANLSETQLFAFSEQLPAVKQKPIQAYAQILHKRSQEDDPAEGVSKGNPDDTRETVPDVTKGNRLPSEEEMTYKTIRRKGKEPISIILDERESAAAQAAMG